MVGQITPTMLQHIRYGTFIFFGLVVTGGKLCSVRFLPRSLAHISTGLIFVFFFVPETRRLTLEEMDILFGSRGVAAQDKKRMTEINREIGLEALLANMGINPAGSGIEDEKGIAKDGFGGASSSEEDIQEEKGAIAQKENAPEVKQ